MKLISGNDTIIIDSYPYIKLGRSQGRGPNFRVLLHFYVGISGGTRSPDPTLSAKGDLYSPPPHLTYAHTLSDKSTCFIWKLGWWWCWRIFRFGTCWWTSAFGSGWWMLCKGRRVHWPDWVQKIGGIGQTMQAIPVACGYIVLQLLLGIRSIYMLWWKKKLKIYVKATLLAKN